MRARILFAPALLVFVACPTPERPAVVGDPAADRTQIEQLRDQWRAAADRRDAAAIAGLYADDATFVGPGVPELSGRNAIQQSFAEQLQTFTVTSVDSRDLQVGPEIAYDYGRYTQQVAAPGAQPQTVNGYYLVTLRRQADGAWRITRHLSTVPDLPTSPGAPATQPPAPGTARPPGAAPPPPPAQQPGTQQPGTQQPGTPPPAQQPGYPN